LAKTVTIKPEETFARAYADRLILEKLTEMESAMKLGELADKLSGAGLGLAAVRSLLASNPEAYTYHERRWIPTSRLEGQGRPFHEAVRLIVDRFGGPMPLELLAREVSRVRGEPLDVISPAVRRTVVRDDTFIVTSKDEVALTTWAFLAHDETIERALKLHGLELHEVEKLAQKLSGVDWRAEDAVQKALKTAAPVGARQLGAVAWMALNPQDPRTTLIFNGRAMFAEILATPGYVLGADGVVYPESETKKWIVTTLKLADKLAPLVDVEDAAPIDIKPEDVDRMVAKILASDESTTATRLLEEFYEVTIVNKTFPDDMASILAALKARPEIWWVGGDRFRKPNTAPDFIYEVPEPFSYPQLEFRDAEGELVDVELTDDGLSSSLRKLLTHPLATDVMDEDILPSAKQQPEQLRLVLKSIHRELGTFPLCQIPTGWLAAEPPVQEIVLIDPNGRELQAWVNFNARLIYNLVDWWYEQPVESGSVFSFQHTSRPNVLDFAWLEQTDPVVYISTQRMEELRDIQARSDDMSTLELLIEVMGHWPKGADFLTVLAEINVVRRSTRRLIASLLSSYQCFYQRSGSPVWHFDSKKVDLGFDKTKKKFIRK
jgi:hypothetical protein